jgi:hypothetical protein
VLQLRQLNVSLNHLYLTIIFCRLSKSKTCAQLHTIAMQGIFQTADLADMEQKSVIEEKCSLCESTIFKLHFFFFFLSYFKELKNKLYQTSTNVLTN